MFHFTAVLKTGVRLCSSGYRGLLIAHAVTGLISNVFCLELARKKIKNRETSKPEFEVDVCNTRVMAGWLVKKVNKGNE